MKSCPFCSQEIQDSAIKCKHCKEWLKTNSEPQTAAQQKSIVITCPKCGIKNTISYGQPLATATCGRCKQSLQEVNKISNGILKRLLAYKERYNEHKAKKLQSAGNASSPAQSGAKGVRGWLMLLVVHMLVINPLLGISIIGSSFATLEKHPEIKNLLQWDTYKSAAWGVAIVFAGLSMYGGLGLARGKDWSVVRRAKLILWLIGPISNCILIFLSLLILGGSLIQLTDPVVYGGLIGSIFWAHKLTEYLAKSKRVRNTYVAISHM